MQKLDNLIAIEQVYSRLLNVKNVNIICSKPYGFELFFLLFKNSTTDNDCGIEDTFDAIKYNRCTRPAFINFINYLEFQNILYRSKSKIKKNKVLLRLHRTTIIEVNKIID
jgi:hypothetical protein